MGTANSILSKKNLIYFSYTIDNINNKYLQDLIKVFMILDYQILTSNIVVDCAQLEEKVITLEFQNMMLKAEFVFVCISNSVINSNTHLFELKTIYSMNKNVIFLILEKELNTEVQEYLQKIINKNKIYPLFDDDCYNNLISILKNIYNIVI